MSERNHDSVDIKIPDPAHPRKRFAAPVNSTITPERTMPNGDAAEASAIITEFTLPSIFIGTTVWAMGFSIRKERWFGTLESIYVTPTSRLSQVLGMALHSTIHQSMGTAIQFLVVYLIFGLTLKIGGILPALGIFALMLFALYGFGLLLSAVGLLLKEGWIVADGLYSIMMILSPVAYPLAVLPNLAQQASAIFPTAPALIGIRAFFIENYQLEVLGNVFLHLAALSITWILFGILVFRLTDSYVRKRDGLKKF